MYCSFANRPKKRRIKVIRSGFPIYEPQAEPQSTKHSSVQLLKRKDQVASFGHASLVTIGDENRASILSTGSHGMPVPRNKIKLSSQSDKKEKTASLVIDFHKANIPKIIEEQVDTPARSRLIAEDEASDADSVGFKDAVVLSADQRRRNFAPKGSPIKTNNGQVINCFRVASRPVTHRYFGQSKTNPQ